MTKRRRIAKTIAFCASLLPLGATARAQEVAYLDLTNVTARTEVRHPPVPEDECTVHHICEFFKGGVIGGDVAPDDQRAVRTTITWMDRLEYTDGDRAELEAMVENVGQVPIDLPWTPHLADLQPADNTTAFGVATFGISVELKWPSGESFHLGSLVFFGSSTHPGTLLNLRPGEWVRLRASTRLSLLGYKGARLPPLAASEGAIANSWLRLEQYSPQIGGLIVHEKNIYPHRFSGNPVSVHILPRE